jgi:hypothetical protein
MLNNFATIVGFRKEAIMLRPVKCREVTGGQHDLQHGVF